MKGARTRLITYWSNLPRWYRIIFSIIAIVYLVAWISSIYIKTTNSEANIPILPKDSTGYVELAESLFSNHSFIDAAGKAETFRTPGYPFFIGTFNFIFGSYFAVTFVQIILILLAGLMIERIGRRLFSPRVGAITSLAFLINPITLVLSLVILSDILFVFLYILMFWLITEFISKKSWFVTINAGIIAACALYVRPMGALAFPIFISPIILSALPWKRMVISAVVLGIISFILVAPWMERNRQATGVFAFSSLAPYNITSYNIPMYRAHKNHTSVTDEFNKIVADVGSFQDEWRSLESSPKLKKYIGSFIKENFFGYGIYHSITTLPFFFASDIEWSLRLYHIAINSPFDSGSKAAIFDLAQGNIGSFLSKLTTPWWKFTERLWLCFLVLCSIYALVRMRRKPAIWICAGIILYIALLTGPVSDARYRLSADPFIYLVASAGLVSFLERRSRSTPSRRRPFLYRT